MNGLRPILLAEDTPNDAELTLEALASSALVNQITHVQDGVAALEFLRCTGPFAGRIHCNRMVKPVKFEDFLNAVKEIGVFWAMVNEVPPDCQGNDCGF